MDINRIILNHYKKVQKQNNKYFKCAMNPADIKEWYVLVSDMEEPYNNGQYLFRLVMKDTFPDTAPSLRAMTPNGVFTADNLPICTSIGEFHENMFDKSGSYGYRSALGIYGFIMNSIVNAMLTSEVGNHGIRYIVVSKEERQRLAAESKSYNETKFSHILKMFE